MNNMTTTRTLPAIVVLILTASVLASSIMTVPSTVFAYVKKGAQDNENGNNGNTATDQAGIQSARESGFDNIQKQEAQNSICINPENPATCLQEGVTTPIPIPTPQPPTTGTLLVKKVVVCADTPCRVIPLPKPSEFTITMTGNNPIPSEFLGSGSGTLVTLRPGEYVVKETVPQDQRSFEVFADFSGDCKGALGNPRTSATGTIAAGDEKACTITNLVVAR
jgi:hypothetical protein